jgi:K+-sensing histidine kinase KdpD
MDERLLGKNNKFGRVKIYMSKFPGLGKTYEIVEDI